MASFTRTEERAVEMTGVRLADGYVIDDGSLSGLQVSYFSQAHLLLKTQGTLRASLSVTLPGNAVVDRFAVRILARRADVTRAATVAQLRGEPGEGPNDWVIVLDFGTLRTVSRIAFAGAANIRKVEAWNGTEFPRYATHPYLADSSGAEALGGNAAVALHSDIRTQKLRVSVRASGGLGALLEGMDVILPDAPRDLSLRIDGGAPVWSLPGPAVAGDGAELSSQDWNESGERLIDLSAEMTARTGDPANADMRTFELLLESAEAGVLQIAPHESLFRRIRRVEGGAVDLDFEAEGQTMLPLELPEVPANARVQALSLRASGMFKGPRHVPATGPDPALNAEATAALAEMTLTPEQAVIFCPAHVEGVPELGGVRLSLAAGPEGAEVSLVPWSGRAGADLPDAALTDLTGDPVTLVPGASGWVTLSLGAPVPLEAANPLWVAVLVNRGMVTTGLATGGAPLRVGPAGGPWRALPRAFSVPPFAGLGLACRFVGMAEDPLVPAPVSLQLGGQGVALDPTPKGQAVTFDPGDPGLPVPPVLTITRLTSGTLTLAEIDVITDI